MKVIVSILSGLLCFTLFSCKHHSNTTQHTESAYVVETEYANEYSNGSLVKSTLNEFEVVNDQKKLANTHEYQYTYQDNVLKSKKEFQADESGTMVLKYIANYTLNSKEYISLNGSDTISYSLQVFDDNGRLILQVKKETMVFSDFNYSINEDFEEKNTYSAEGNKVSTTIIDKANGVAKEITYTYNNLPDNITVTPYHEQVSYLTEAAGDTVISKRFVNLELADVHKVLEIDNYKLQQSFNAQGLLLLMEETATNGNMKIEVVNFLEYNSTDSIFFENDRKVRSVSVMPDSKIEVTYEYDSYGNVQKEKRTVIY